GLLACQCGLVGSGQGGDPPANLDELIVRRIELAPRCAGLPERGDGANRVGLGGQPGAVELAGQLLGDPGAGRGGPDGVLADGPAAALLPLEVDVLVLQLGTP